jgi:hypothetical protein
MAPLSSTRLEFVTFDAKGEPNGTENGQVCGSCTEALEEQFNNAEAEMVRELKKVAAYFPEASC